MQSLFFLSNDHSIVVVQTNLFLVDDVELAAIFFLTFCCVFLLSQKPIPSM